MLNALALIPLLAAVAGAVPAQAAADASLPAAVPGTTVQNAQVIILGAGIAGVSAARTLMTEHNITNIIILEARDEVGGRAHTETMADADGKTVTVEKGCNWIQGPGKEGIMAMARKYGLKTAVTHYDNAAWYEGRGIEANGQQGRWFEDAELGEAFASYDEQVLGKMGALAEHRHTNSLVDVSVRVATNLLGWFPMNALQKAYEYVSVELVSAQTADTTSFGHTFGGPSHESDVPDEFVIDPRGYKYIFEQEYRALFGQNLTDPRLKLGKTVTNVDYSAAASGGKIVVKTADGSVYQAPHVISTFSVGVLQHNDVTFTPALPAWKNEAIQTFGMATYQKIFILFDEMFWRPNEEFVMYVDPNEQGRYQVWQNVNAPGYFPTGTKQNVIMVTAIDKFARRNEMLSDEQIKKEVYAILQEMYGQNIPPIRDIAVPRWTIDPLYRGSYSNWPLGAVNEHHLNLGKPVGAMKSWIHFTGEALSAEAFGYVQGAWDEAHKTANTIAQCLSSKCPMVEIYENIKECPQKPTQQFKRNARRVSFTN